MSLDLKDIERGVGADLLRRPLLTSLVNAVILRFFYDTVVEWPDDEKGGADHYQHPDLHPPQQPQQPHVPPIPPLSAQDTLDRNPVASRATTSRTTANKTTKPPPAAEVHTQNQTRQTVVEHIVASFLFLVCHLLLIFGVFEAFFWLCSSVLFKILSLPRIYPFEKCLVDMRALIVPHTMRYVEKSILLNSRANSQLPKFVAVRRGLSAMPITIITPAETLTRDTVSLLRLLRYINRVTIAYFTEDAIVLAGRNDDIVHALCNLSEEPIDIDLGWHKDVVEQTTFKLTVKFTRESASADDRAAQLSPIRAVGLRVVVVQLQVETTTQNLEMILRSLDQFAAVCEAAERGRRLFNGKRAAIYFVGITMALLLIFYYEPNNLDKPSVDVLTIAVGAYTLWMTIGKSAALGDTEEETALTIPTRENIMLAYHGLARIDDNIINTCWVPEIYRIDKAEPAEDAEIEDGSITVVEAAVYLSIFMHYGHMIKWKGARLILDRYRIDEQSGDPMGVGHVVGVQRVPNINNLQYEGEMNTLERIGGSGARDCRHHLEESNSQLTLLAYNL